jgi:hypothetical protein
MVIDPPGRLANLLNLLPVKTESLELRAHAARAMVSTVFWRLAMNSVASWPSEVVTGTGGGLGARRSLSSFVSRIDLFTTAGARHSSDK